MNIAETTLLIGLCLEYLSVFKQIKARRLERAFSEDTISITLVRRLNSLFSLSIMFIVLNDTQSSAGNLKKVKAASSAFSRHLVAENQRTFL